MTKKFLICLCLTLSTVIFHFGIGMSANQSAEMSAKEAGPQITMVEALNIATDLVPGRVVEAELKDEDDPIFYEIEIISSAGMVVEVQVDANSGHIIKQAREGEVAYITVKEAIKTAQNYLAWHAVEVELEEEDGKAVYEIKLVNNLGDEQEVEIDALSGTVLEPEPKKPGKNLKKQSENGKE